MKTPRIHALVLLAAFPLLTAEADEITLTPIMDAAVSEASPESNYAITSLIVGKYSGQAWESFLQFDCSTIPVNAEITAAELRLSSGNFGAGGTLRLSKPDAGWAEALVKWSNRPTVTTLDDIALTVQSPNSAYLALTAPVLGYLQDVTRSATPNRGLKLEFPSAGSGEFLAFPSREQANAPQLVITYTPGPELPDFTTNLTALDDRLRAELFRAPEGAPNPFELAWNTKPGVRYRLWESPDLAEWSIVPGYPVEADALGAVHEVPLTPPARFFKVEALDEQPPEIVSRFPDDGDFGIKRYFPTEEVGIQLSDATGINPTSLSLTLSGVGTFTISDAELTLNNGLLTLDLGGDTAMGGYGATVNASLTVADILGNSATYDWSFELEKEVVLAEGLFTFGSLAAQRAGQIVPPIPTRMLAERQGAVGPVKANDNGWSIEQVLPDSIVIAYTTSAPVISIDQYLTNMTPATVNEIFYRKVNSVSDDTVNKRLTVGTVDVPAWEIMVDGSVALNGEDVAFETDAEGNILGAYSMRALNASARFELRPLEVDWSGKSIMGLFTLYDETKASFGLPIKSKDPLGNDWDAKLNLKQAKLRLSPKVSISADMNLFDGLRKFRAESRVDVDAVLEPEFEFFGAGIEYAMKAEDKTGEPLLKHPFVIPLGTSPLWVTVTPSLRAEASVNAGVSGTFSIGASGGYGKTMIFDYDKSRNPLLPRIEGQASDFHFDLIDPEVTLSGTVGAEMKIIPEVDVKLMSAVGFYVNLDPALKADLNAELSTGSLASADVGIVFDGHINAGLSIVGIDNSLLPSFDPWEMFSWGKRWYFPQTPVSSPLAILVQPQSQTVQPGGTINLSVQANHSDGVTYEWRKDGRRFFNDSPTLRISNASSASAGDYWVTLNYGGQNVVSQTAIVTVGGFNGGSGLQGGQWVYSGDQYSAIPDEIAVPLLTDFSDIATGYYHSLALRQDGSVVAWGSGSSGQTTVPAAAQSGVVAIAAGVSHSVALRQDGAVIAWGNNTAGQSAVPMSAQSGVVAIDANSFYTVALKDSGSVVAWGSNSFGVTTVPEAAQSGVVAIAAGSSHVVALRENGSVVAWGSNSFGETTVPSVAQEGVIAIAAGNWFTVALKDDGSVVVWGSNYGGATVPVEAQSGVIDIVAGDSHIVALKGNGSVVGWGSNSSGQSTVPVSAQSEVIAIAAGQNHTLALRQDGLVVAWGSNDQGALAVPAGVKSDVIAIAAGSSHTVALKQDGSVVAWGQNNYGQTTIPAAAQSEVMAIAAGGSHSVALTQDGSVVAWGKDSSGQSTVPEAAHSSIGAISAGSSHSVALKQDGSVIAWGYSGYGVTTVPTAAQSGVIAVAAGGYHTVALKQDGSVVAWGQNNYGETTVPASAQSGVIAIATGSYHTVVLKQDGSVLAWGDNSSGQTTVPMEAQSGVIAISAAGSHTVALKQDGSVVAWGRNTSGQTNVPTEAESGVAAITTGGAVTFFRLGAVGTSP